MYFTCWNKELANLFVLILKSNEQLSILSLSPCCIYIGVSEARQLKDDIVSHVLAATLLTSVRTSIEQKKEKNLLINALTANLDTSASWDCWREVIYLSEQNINTFFPSLSLPLLVRMSILFSHFLFFFRFFPLRSSLDSNDYFLINLNRCGSLRCINNYWISFSRLSLKHLSTYVHIRQRLFSHIKGGENWTIDCHIRCILSIQANKLDP